MRRGAVIGTVDAVEPHVIRVLLEIDAPQATALNTGLPAPFPRINGYVLLPNEVGATVGMVSAVRIERAPYPKRPGLKDFGLVDLPFPQRALWVTPIGTLVRLGGDGATGYEVEVRRGVDVFPSVGDPVVLPDAGQLRAIVEGDAGGGAGTITIGRSPIVGGAAVNVDPNRMFGRHLAVLGNTGSGKSCSVAGLVRWCLEAATRARKREGRPPEPNARFIVLDPNGEYADAFADLEVRVLQVDPSDGKEPLRLPAWLWNGEEWVAFSGAAPGVQRPMLLDALRRIRMGTDQPDEFDVRLARYLRLYSARFQTIMNSGEFMGYGKRDGTATLLGHAVSDLDELAADDACPDGVRKAITATTEAAHESVERAKTYVDKNGVQRHDDFAVSDIESIVRLLRKACSVAGVRILENADEDRPMPFPVEQLPDFVEALAAASPGRDLAQFVETMKLRIHGLMSRSRLAEVAGSDEGDTLVGWLDKYLGGHQPDAPKVTVVDLSLIPSDVVHVIVAVLARLVFEALQRYRRAHGDELPTVLVLDEAHSFAHREQSNEAAPASARLCCRTMERIAREGRKFGLGLVLASQRPSELSPTVLSQCNTFLLHRLVNDRDQNLVRRLVPDSLGGLLNELPSLPARRAVLLGWAVPAPVLVEINELPEGHRPHSPDPAFWEVWTGDPDDGQRDVDLDALAAEWSTPSTSDGGDE